MRITKYLQSCFLLETKGRRVLIDPGSYNDERGYPPEKIGTVDLVLLTHRHPDHTHFPTLQYFYGRHVPIVCNHDVENVLRKSNVRVTAVHPEEVKTFNGVIVKATHSVHGDPPDGSSKPPVVGFVVDGTFYHPGDTDYLHEVPHATVAALPIAGPEMNPVKAAAMAYEVRPKLAIPMHYDSPKFPGNPEDFIRSMSATGIPVRVLEPGESVEV